MQRIVKFVPRLLFRRSQFAPVAKDHILVTMKFEAEAFALQVHGSAKILQVAHGIAIGNKLAILRPQPESVCQAPLPEHSAALVHRCGRNMDRATRALIHVVIDDDRALVARAVRVGEHILIHRSMLVPEVIQNKVSALRKQVAAFQQRRNLALIAVDHALVRLLAHARLLEVHAIALTESLNLSMRKHRQPWKGCKQRAGAKVLVAVAELIGRRAFVGVAHEIDIALQDVWIKLNRLLEIRPVLGILFIAQHVHEGAVIHTVHPQRADEISLQQPESLRQQERSRNLCGDPVDYLSPELVRHQRIEFLLRHRVFRPRRNGPANARQGEP